LSHLSLARGADKYWNAVYAIADRIAAAATNAPLPELGGALDWNRIQPLFPVPASARSSTAFASSSLSGTRNSRRNLRSWPSHAWDLPGRRLDDDFDCHVGAEKLGVAKMMLRIPMPLLTSLRKSNANVLGQVSEIAKDLVCDLRRRFSPPSALRMLSPQL
jgi:hypothetical protein